MLNQRMGDTVTPREQMIWAHEKDMTELHQRHALEIKKLELELTRAEAKWSALLRLPKFFLLLPVLIILSFGAVVSAFRKSDFSAKFWELLR